MSDRVLKLTIVEADGETNPIWVAVYPIRAEDEPIPGSTSVWPADDPEDVGQFFKDYIVKEWTGIASGKRELG